MFSVLDIAGWKVMQRSILKEALWQRRHVALN